MKPNDVATINFSLEHLQDSVIWVNPEGEIIKVNQLMAHSLGYSKQELEQLSIFDINPLINKVVWNQLGHQLNKKKQLSMETQHRHKLGHLFPVEASISLVELEGETLIFATARNTTDEKRFRRLFEFTEEIAHIGAWDWDLVTGEVHYTNEVIKIFGATPDIDLTLELGFSLCAEESLNRLQDAIAKTIEEGVPFEMNVEAVSLKGERQDVFISVIPHVFKGKVIKLLGILQNVTDKTGSEVFLQMKGFTIDEVSDMVFWVDQSGKFVFVNNAVAQAHGIDKESLLDKYVWDIAPLVEKKLWESRWKMFRTKKQLEYESVHRREDGLEFPVDVRINFLKFKEEEYICAVLRDITLQKQKEEELNNALEELEKLKDLLQAENEYLQEDIRLQHNFSEIITVSPKYQKVLKTLEGVAPTDASVLILGETGTGKELLARAIHKLSLRNQRALIKINCATLPSNLIESELFGHERGAFTGADKRKIGRFELADKGTIFLDEIGELPLELQSKLLRVLQEGEFSRLGNNNNLKTDVRVLTATNRDLIKLVKEGKFRSDLYYRLNVFPIDNIPLRERKEDIPILAQHFLKKYSEKTGKNVRKISQKTMKKLINYRFPGNIRELENIIERSVILSPSNTLNLDHWQSDPLLQAESSIASFEEVQKDHIIRALKQSNWRVSGGGGAAELLELHPKTLDSKMRKFGIRRNDFMEK